MSRGLRQKESDQNALDQGVEAIATQIVDVAQQGTIDEDNAEIRRFVRSTKQRQKID